MLLIDDITIQCEVHLSEPVQVDSISILTMNAILLITTPDASKCRESLQDDVCPVQAHSIGVGTSEVTLYGFGGNCNNYCPVESIVGRRTNLVAYEGATLVGVCRPGYPPAIDGPDVYIGERIVTGMGRLFNATPKR
jgi:hypothetical protein